MRRTRQTKELEVSPEDAGKARQFVRYLMSYVDFGQAAEIAGYILREELHNRYPKDRFLLQGLNCGMVVAYCRPFSRNDRGAQPQIPHLPRRILDNLSPDERELHKTLIEERNTVLAHSDSRAWEPRPQILRLPGNDMLLPVFKDVHAPLAREATEHLKGMAEKLREACFEERCWLEKELRPYLPKVDGSKHGIVYEVRIKK